MNDSIIIKLIKPSEILSIVPLIAILDDFKVSEEVLNQRFTEMIGQNYKCAGIYDGETLIGCSGLWFQTRHYAGRSIEMDHVIVLDDYRSKGIGAMLLDFVYDYAKKKDCNWVELNTYVHNFPSHKFYYRHGFVAKGYHFVKEL
ncbi:MAG: GNAT superfamily N-acetyltransferase [Patiriisocius sp.]